jgi:hypothetical protein
MNRIHRTLVAAITLLLLTGSVGWWLNRTSDLDGYTLPVPDQVQALFNPVEPSDLSDPIDQVLRLAIGPLADVPPHQSAQFQDLLLAELGKDPKLELVERGELDRILQETELGLANLTNPTNAARLGHMVRAKRLLLAQRVELQSPVIVARLVDTRSGILRNLTAIADDPVDPFRTIAAVADFIRASGHRPANVTSPQFLAFGSFHDLGVNPRHPELPRQLRSHLAQLAQRRGITLVEREFIDLLIQEVRLNLAGLVADADPVPSMQAAFWLVDGHYQVFEQEQTQLDLVLRVERVRGPRTLHRISGIPGEPLYSQAWDALASTLNQTDRFFFQPTRAHEFKLQMARGRELTELRRMTHGMDLPTRI